MNLFDNVKKYLKITWDDEDEELKELIKEAKDDLQELVGCPIVFEKIEANEEENIPEILPDLKAVSLLKDYCRYVRNYSKEYFIENFKSDILSLQLKYADIEVTKI